MEASAFVVFLAAVVVSRMISERGYRTLESEDKLRLMDGFSKKRMYSMLPLLALIGLYWYFSTQTELGGPILTIAYFGLLILYVVVNALINNQILKRLEMPESYCRSFSIAQVISFLGVAWFFYAIFQGM
jgi:hypothetical protein